MSILLFSILLNAVHNSSTSRIYPYFSTVSPSLPSRTTRFIADVELDIFFTLTEPDVLAALVWVFPSDAYYRNLVIFLRSTSLEVSTLRLDQRVVLEEFIDRTIELVAEQPVLDLAHADNRFAVRALLLVCSAEYKLNLLRSLKVIPASLFHDLATAHRINSFPRLLLSKVLLSLASPQYQHLPARTRRGAIRWALRKFHAENAQQLAFSNYAAKFAVDFDSRQDLKVKFVANNVEAIARTDGHLARAIATEASEFRAMFSMFGCCNQGDQTPHLAAQLRENMDEAQRFIQALADAAQILPMNILE